VSRAAFVTRAMTALRLTNVRPRTGLVVVLVRPAKPVPKWWPRCADRSPSWATIDFTEKHGFCGYSGGVCVEHAMPTALASAALVTFAEDYIGERGAPTRIWEVKFLRYFKGVSRG
jgi:hypothetical protein